jgi:hypothetical protein
MCDASAPDASSAEALGRLFTNSIAYYTSALDVSSAEALGRLTAHSFDYAFFGYTHADATFADSSYCDVMARKHVR